MPFNRSRLLTVFLVLALLSVASRVILLWLAAPSDLPRPDEVESRTDPGTEVEGEISPPAANVRNIVERNLFDPERRIAAGKALPSNGQHLQGLVLVGTALLGPERVAIFRPPGAEGHLRLRVGDHVDGFRLSEIHQRRVVFTRGASRVEIPLDLSARSESSQKTSPSPEPQPSAPVNGQPQ